MEATKDPRYPYTHACDLIRCMVGVDENGSVSFSRSQASSLRSSIAEAIGMDDEEFARKLADYYLQHKDRIAEETAKKILSKLVPNFNKDQRPVETTLVKVGGKSFRCEECGSNCFHHPDCPEGEDLFDCNSCGTRYRGGN